MERRDELLLKMYETLNNEISRHITIVWQSVSVVLGAFTILSFVEKNVINLDLAIGIILLLILWLFEHLIDAAYWYNRNLVMIANIERQFLEVSDLKDIHYYFGKHRKNNKMLTHLKIQRNLGIGLAVLVIGFHFFTRVYPGFTLPWSDFDPIRAIPYAIVFIAVIYLPISMRATNKKYAEFITESPGKVINTSGTHYGVGHPSE